jgi:hypothetical protein
MSMRRLICCLTATVAAVLILSDLRAAQEFKSGLAPGRMIGGPFLPYNVNGKKGKDRYHDLVCEFGNNPVVAVFVREGPEANDAPVWKLLEEVDRAVKRHREDAFLHAFAIFLSRDARSSITEKRNENPDELIAEAKAREKLKARLSEKAAPLEYVVVGMYPYASLKGYGIGDQPGVTVLVYAKHKVLANYAFPEGKLTDNEIGGVIKGVDALMKKERRRPKIKK